MLKTQPYPEMYPPEDDSYHPLAVSRTMFVDRIDRDVGETIMEYLDASDAAMRVAQLRVLGGAMARVPADATAYAHRASPIMVNVAAFYDGPDDKPIREAWVAEFVGGPPPGRHRGVRQLPRRRGRDARPGRVPGHDLGPPGDIKRRWDPDNLFRLNQNIPPAGADGAAG